MVKINHTQLKNRTIIVEDYFVFLLIEMFGNFAAILLTSIWEFGASVLTKMFGFVVFFSWQDDVLKREIVCELSSFKLIDAIVYIKTNR